jgi:ABC-type antimicrobial peptide transport system permease subunit
VEVYLYGVAPGDAGTLLMVAGVLAAAAAAASLGPTVRALRISPAESLRGE